MSGGLKEELEAAADWKTSNKKRVVGKEGPGAVLWGDNLSKKKLDTQKPQRVIINRGGMEELV